MSEDDIHAHTHVPAGGGLLAYYEVHGLTWGAADLLAVQGGDAATRAGALVAIFRAFTADNRPAVREILVVWPPLGDEAQVAARIKAGVARFWAERAMRVLTESEVDALWRAVRIVRAETLEQEHVVALIRAAPPATAVIVSHAALYRAADVGAPDADAPGPEDFWAPHVHRLLVQAVATHDEAGAYVVVDAGEDLPTAGVMRDLLLSVDGCGVLSPNDVQNRPGTGRIPASHLARWEAMAAGGQLGAAFAEVAALDGAPARVVAMLRARLFTEAGLTEEARAALKPLRAEAADLSPEDALEVARLAEALSEDRLAATLLRAAVPELIDRERLELALGVAEGTGHRSVIAKVESRLAALHPTSRVLRRHRAEAQIDALVASRRYRGVAEVLRGLGEPDADEAAVLWDLVAGYCREDGGLDLAGFVAAVSSTAPGRADDARVLGAWILERVGERREALEMLLEGAPEGARPDQDLSLAMLRTIERARLANDRTVDDQLAVVALGRVLEGVARRACDLPTRTRLARLLQPQLLASTGPAMLAMCIIQFLNRPVDLRDDPHPGAHATTRTPDALRGVLARGAEWLGAEGTVLLGRRTLPHELLDLPADDAIALFDDLLTVGCERLDDEEDVAGFKFALALALATAPLGSRPHHDLAILRSVATRLAHVGRPQLARDLAEHALASAGDDPHRLRLAWAAYADVHARAGAAIDAMIGVACALVSGADATWEQAWHETTLLLRIFRDVGLATFAEPLLARARAALAHVDPSGRHAVRVETMALQLEFASAVQTAALEPVALELLLARIVDNARGVLAARDELAPVASFLAAALQYATDCGVPAPPGAAELVRDLVQRISPELGVRVELATLAVPPIDRVVALAARALDARYAEDIGFDVQYVVALARRLLASDVARDPEAALYAIEATADQAITLPTGEGQSIPAPHLLARRDGPLEAARSLGRESVSVVALGVAGNGLTRVVVTGGEPALPVVETQDVFTRARLRTWARRYPYSYKDTSDPNAFFTSTAGIGVSTLPERAVIVASTDLQGFPPNLLNVGEDLGGTSHRLAVTPSLAWLVAARRHAFHGDGRMTAWIPRPKPEAGISTLAVLADRLSTCFHTFGVDALYDARLPDGLAGSDLAVVAAHGGVAAANRYFRGVSDDATLAMSSASLAYALAKVGVVVLFVCSGGRIDRHPEANAMVGLVKQLLDGGCRAVIAPPWPLETSVPPHWLPAFLAQWTAGSPVIDACFVANAAVRGALGDDPGRCLAMTVYGDPLAAATARASGTEPPSSG